MKPLHPVVQSLLLAVALVGVTVGPAAISSAGAPIGTDAVNTEPHSESVSSPFRSGTVTVRSDGKDETLYVNNVPNFDLNKSAKTLYAKVGTTDGRTVEMNLRGDYDLIGLNVYVTGGSIKVSDGPTIPVSGKTEISYDSAFNLGHIWTGHGALPTSNGSCDFDIGQKDPVAPTSVKLSNETAVGQYTFVMQYGIDPAEQVFPGQARQKFELSDGVFLPRFLVVGYMTSDTAEPLTIQEMGVTTNVKWGPRNYNVMAGQSVVLWEDAEYGVELTFSRSSSSNEESRNHLVLRYKP